MYCPKCGKVADPSVRFCPSCGTQVGSGNLSQGVPYATGGYPQAKLIRPQYPRMIAGVCAAFALQYGWDLNLVRVLTAVAAVFTSGGVGIAYLVAWVLIPEAPFALPPQAGTYPTGQASTGYAPPPPGAPHDSTDPAV